MWVVAYVGEDVFSGNCNFGLFLLDSRLGLFLKYWDFFMPIVSTARSAGSSRDIDELSRTTPTSWAGVPVAQTTPVESFPRV